jgi:type II secretory pathway component PulJ
MSLATDAQLSRVRNAAQRRRQLEGELEEAITQLRAEMQRAREAGHSTTDIGTAAGMSRQRVNLTTREA